MTLTGITFFLAIFFSCIFFLAGLPWVGGAFAYFAVLTLLCGCMGLISRPTPKP